MIALMKLYFASWWRSFMGPIFVLVFPPLILFMLGQITPFSWIAPTYILYCALSLGVQSFAISLVQFKNSSLIKRIGQTPITRTQFVLSLFLFNFFLIILAGIFIIFIMYIYQEFNLVQTTAWKNVITMENNVPTVTRISVDAKIIWEKVQWFWVIFIASIGMIYSIALGLFLAVIFKTVERTNGAGLLALFCLTFLGGVFFPIEMMQRAKLLEYWSLLTPMRYLAQSLQWAFNGSFDFFKIFEVTKTVSKDIVTEVWSVAPIYVFLLLSLLYSAVLVGISIVKFKWE